jgi:hypothetical protein
MTTKSENLWGKPGWCRARANDTKPAAPTLGTSGSRTSADSRPVHVPRRPGRPAPGRRRRPTLRQITELCAERGHHREEGHGASSAVPTRVPRQNAQTTPTGRENTPVATPGRCHRCEHPLSVEVFGRSSDRALTVPKSAPEAGAGFLGDTGLGMRRSAQFPAAPGWGRGRHSAEQARGRYREPLPGHTARVPTTRWTGRSQDTPPPRWQRHGAHGQRRTERPESQGHGRAQPQEPGVDPHLQRRTSVRAGRSRAAGADSGGRSAGPRRPAAGVRAREVVSGPA